MKTESFSKMVDVANLDINDSETRSNVSKFFKNLKAEAIRQAQEKWEQYKNTATKKDDEYYKKLDASENEARELMTEAIKTTLAENGILIAEPAKIAGKSWNKTVYGKAGNYSIYANGQKVILSDDEAVEIQKHLKSTEACDKILRDVTAGKFLIVI